MSAIHSCEPASRDTDHADAACAFAASRWCVWALILGPAMGWSLVAVDLREDDARMIADALLLRTQPMPQGQTPTPMTGGS